METEEFTELPPLSGDDTEDSDAGLPSSSKKNVRKRGPRRAWEIVKTFSTAAEAEKAVADEGNWSRVNKSSSFQGEKVKFRCTETPAKSNNPCKASVQLLYCSDSTEVILYRFTDTHDHADAAMKKGIKPEMKEVIKELFEDGITVPISIFEALKRRKLETPTTFQLNNFLNSYRREKYGPGTISMNDLKNWCESRKSIPEEIDKPFVVDSLFVFEVDQDEQDFKIFLTTKKLLLHGLKSELLQADATYKLV